MVEVLTATEVAWYRKANPICELYQFEMIPAKFRCKKPSEVHHIFSVRRRLDLLSVIINLSQQAHLWCHENPIEGRILCLLVKARKEELDVEEIRKASGMYPAGWLAMKRGQIRLEWVVPYADELEELLNET